MYYTLLSKELLLKEAIREYLSYNDSYNVNLTEAILLFENKNGLKIINTSQFFNYLNQGILIPILSFNMFVVNVACEPTPSIVSQIEQTAGTPDTANTADSTEKHLEEPTIVDPDNVTLFNIKFSAEVINSIESMDKDLQLKSTFKKLFRVNKSGHGKLKKPYAKFSMRGKDCFVIDGKLHIKKIKKYLTKIGVSARHKKVIIGSVLGTMRAGSSMRLAAFVVGNIMTIDSTIPVTFYTWAHESGHIVHSDFDKSWRKKTYRLFSLFNERDATSSTKDGIKVEDIPSDLMNVFNYYLRLKVFERSIHGMHPEGFTLTYRSNIVKIEPGADEAGTVYDKRRNEGVEYGNQLFRSVKDLLESEEESFFMPVLEKILEKGIEYKSDYNLRVKDRHARWASLDKNKDLDEDKWFLTEIIGIPDIKAKKLLKNPAFVAFYNVIGNKVYEGEWVITVEKLRRIVEIIKRDIKSPNQ
jgi:hypothetical protein